KAVEYLPPERRAKFKPFEDHYATKGLLHSDPPDHTRLRALVTREFTVMIVEKMRPRIQEVVDGLLDAAEKNGRMDVVPDLAAALPVQVIAEILGAPPPTTRGLDGQVRSRGIRGPAPFRSGADQYLRHAFYRRSRNYPLAHLQ